MDALVILSTARFPGDGVEVELFASPEQLQQLDVAQWFASQSAPPTWRRLREAHRWLLAHGFVPLAFDEDGLFRLMAIGKDVLRIQLSPVSAPTVQSLRDVQAGRIVMPLVREDN